MLVISGCQKHYKTAKIDSCLIENGHLLLLVNVEAGIDEHRGYEGSAAFHPLGRTLLIAEVELSPKSSNSSPKLLGKMRLSDEEALGANRFELAQSNSVMFLLGRDKAIFMQPLPRSESGTKKTIFFCRTIIFYS